jgi:hypothetical protein
MEFSKFATMVQGHGCAPQTSVEFTCKCAVNFTTEIYALPFTGEDHECEFLKNKESVNPPAEAPHAKMPANPPAKGPKRAKDEEADSVASSKSNKSFISAISDGMIDDNKFYCLEETCKTKRFKSFQKESTWRLHMYQVNYYPLLLITL